MAEVRGGWQTFGEKTVYDNRWVRLGLVDVEAPNGERWDYHVVHLDRIAVALIVDDRDRVLLLWRYRFITEQWGYELQAFVLIDAAATGDAVDLLDGARRRADATSPRVLRSWLAAAHGEALAAHGDRTASLHSFDRAAELLPSDAADERPYVALDTVHLARWRGHALARFGDPYAITVLTDALARLDPSFVRAETALRVDLATALAATGDRDEARHHTDHAAQLAAQLGSARQRRRIATLLAAVS